MNISLEMIKKLRAETLAGVSDCRMALEDAGGDFAKAKKLLAEHGLEKAAKKANKETSQGLIESYIHAGDRIGVLLELRCETDFVARNAEFKNLAHELVMQIAAMNPKNIAELSTSGYIRDTSQTIDSLIKQTIAKVGENIIIHRFIRYELGES